MHTELIGNTPLVKLSGMHSSQAEIFAKAEFLNPGGSVKDRIGLAMITEAEKEGRLEAGSTIIEATSGNTGIALAWIGASKGYKVVLTMPDSMSTERQKLLKAFGAELVLTPAGKGMQGAVDKAIEIENSLENSFLPRQFKNQANPQAHYLTTGPEIWEQTSGKIDIFVTGVGTGGTISGVGKYLKKQNPKIKIIAVEPEDSPVISGGSPAPHKIQGIGAGFVPDVLDLDLLDETITVSDKDAVASTKRIAETQGLLVGISAGANVAAALRLAARNEYQGKKIITILPDTGERYLSTGIFN